MNRNSHTYVGGIIKSAKKVSKSLLKFIRSEKALKLDKISKFIRNYIKCQKKFGDFVIFFLVFSEYMNFNMVSIQPTNQDSLLIYILANTTGLISSIN